MQLEKFKDKTVLVTGGSTGIGFATAQAFLSQGANVVFSGRSKDAGNKACQELSKISQNVTFIQSDASQADEVKQLISKTVDVYGGMDIAFNNAGIEGTFGPILGISDEEMSDVIDINLKGAWLCCKYEMQYFIDTKKPGVIVNTSSWLAKGAFAGSSVYSASKAGLDGMVHSLALEGGEHGIRVNNVNPGYILTPMFSRFFEPDSPEAAPFLAHAPVNRFGGADEVAELVLWLSSDAASFVTGQAISVDGGLGIAGQR